MAGPVYKIFRGRMRKAWYELSRAEQDDIIAKAENALAQSGGKTVIMCRSASDQWSLFGIEEFPDIDAVVKHKKLLDEANWFCFCESESQIGTSWER